MLWLCWDQKGVVYHERLKPGETVNTNRSRQEMINLNHALIQKTIRMGQKIRQSYFVTRQSENRFRIQQSWLGAATPSAVFNRLGPIRLPFVFIDGTRIGTLESNVGLTSTETTSTKQTVKRKSEQLTPKEPPNTKRQRGNNAQVTGGNNHDPKT